MSRKSPNRLEEDKGATLVLTMSCAFPYGSLNINKIFFCIIIFPLAAKSSTDIADWLYLWSQLCLCDNDCLGRI